MEPRELVEDLVGIMLDEGKKAYPPGTQRTWGDSTYEKQKNGKWKRVGAGGKASSKPKAPKKADTEKTSKTVKLALEKDPKLSLPEPPSLDEHVAIALDMVAKHQKTRDEKLAALKSMAPPNASVKGRVKDPESAVLKVARKPKYGTAKKLQDFTGTRVIVNTVDEVKDTVKKIKEKYEIVEEDDYVDTPRDGYRSHHLIAKDDQGLEFEIQIRTKNQNTWADWAHDVYKPVDAAQEDALEQYSDDINDYRLKMSAFYYNLDNPKVKGVPRPKCPPVVANTFGCMA